MALDNDDLGNEETNQNETGNQSRFKFKSYTPSSKSEFMRYAPRAAAAVVVLILLILIGRQVHHQYVQNHPPKSVGQTASKAQPQASGSTSTSSSSKKTSKSSTTHSSGKLVNTGPGNVAAVFASVTVAGACLHYLASSRRQTSR